jgi:hypothetical protein
LSGTVNGVHASKAGSYNCDVNETFHNAPIWCPITRTLVGVIGEWSSG